MMRREGEVLFNGAKMEKHMKRAIGYVMQDDLLYESLTVYETVRVGNLIALVFPRWCTLRIRSTTVHSSNSCCASNEALLCAIMAPTLHKVGYVQEWQAGILGCRSR